MKKVFALFIAIFLCLNISALAGSERINRVEFVAYIMSRAGVINSDNDVGFIDISEEDKYYNYVAAAKEYKIVNGYLNNTFRPYADITKQDAIVMLSRLYKVSPVSGVYINGFSDYGDIGEYAVGYISAAVRNGIVKYETGKNFNPMNAITLDEMLGMIEGFEQNKNKTMHFSLGYPKILDKNEYNAITVSVRMSKPCTLYYKLLRTDKYFNGFRLRADEVNDFLTAVNIPDVTMDINIYPGDLAEYNLYIVGLDENGNYTDVAILNEVTAHRFSVGEGTKDNPYRIYNEEQLAGIKYHPKAFYRLESDIIISESWEPINIESKGFVGFSGVLDGNYHKITGMNIKKYEKNVGLFSAIYGGTVKNLYVDATVSGNDNVGIIAGVSEGGSISECFVTGRVDASGNNAGGIVGSNNGIIENSVSAAYIVEASNYAGGIAGTNRGEILKCLSAAYTVSADMYASGVAGANIGGAIKYNVCANLYADDVITTKTGRVTTNKQYGKTYGNYCYDKMMGDSSVDFDIESHDGIEVTWDELTTVDFYKNIMGWDTKNIWRNSITDDFRLISLKGFEKVNLIKGITMYSPIKIYTEADLLKVYENPNYHYMLMNDISMSDSVKWNMIGTDESEESGFNGTFEGNNFTISGINIEQEDDTKIYGMFGVISGGIVRNLNLINVAIEGHSLLGGLAGENHGYIENCSVSGKIYALKKNNMLSVGGLVGNNYGIMENITSSVQIRAVGQVLTAGGVVANNEGFIDKADYKGEIKAEQKSINSNAVAGGICGINTGGFIYNSFAKSDIYSKASTSYVGGICGIMNGGEIYKTSSIGQINVNPGKIYETVSYAGGITGLTYEGLVMNGFSALALFIDANMAYSGGIVGYNQLASIQNTYSINMIDSMSGIYNGVLGYAAGICGFSEGGFISDNVAINGEIKTNSYMDKVCNIGSEFVVCENNYAKENIGFYGEISPINSGWEDVESEELKNKQFFFKPVSEGGKLGWIEGEVWYMNGKFPYPVLSGVKNQDGFR